MERPPAIERGRTWLRAALAGPQLFLVGMQFLRVAVLTIYLFGGTRMLGTESYGVLATAVALAGIAATLVGMGSGIGLVRQASRNPAVFTEAWGKCLSLHITTGIVMLLAYVLIANRWLTSSLFAGALLPIGITELLLVPLCSSSGYAFIARARYRTGAMMHFLPSLARLMAVAWLWLWFPTGTIDVATFVDSVMWMMLLAGTLALACTFSLLPFPLRPKGIEALKPDYGVAYAGSNLVNSLSGEADKVVVYELTTADRTGVYAATTRIMSALALPFASLIQSRSHELFAMGTRLGAGHLRFLRRYGLAFLAYGIGCMLAANLVAPWLIQWLGTGFEDGIALIFVLSLWVPLNGFRQLVGSLLTTTDNAWRRSFSDALTTVVFVAASLALIPNEGIMGAAKARTIAEAAGLLSSMVILTRVGRAT